MGRVFSQAVVFLLVCSTFGWAQTGTGNIQGTVTDATGAVLPGATVSITHTQTARQYTTTSTEVGFFIFPSVQVGAYQISVEAPGMEAWKGEMTLQVGQRAEVNPKLTVAGTTTQVTVAGDVTPLITTTSATLANTVERARIEQLPVNGRFVQNLIYMTTPGLEPAGGAASFWHPQWLRAVTGWRGATEPAVADNAGAASQPRHDRGVPCGDQQLFREDESSRHGDPNDAGRNK